ncbi:MAG: hypothetical protein WD871_10065 [Xanthobacteraceae bacterium]
MFLLLYTLAIAPLAAQEAPKALICKFDAQVVSEFSNQWNRKIVSGGPSVTFAAIDLPRSRAQMVGTAGAVDVAVVATGGILNFVHSFNDGYDVTSVFLRNEQGGRAPAIMARHVLLSARPVALQLPGNCELRR